MRIDESNRFCASDTHSAEFSFLGFRYQKMTRRLLIQLTIPPVGVSSRFKSGASSTNWLARQAKDEYVKKARDSDYRARSAFKLLEIDSKLKLLRLGQVVVECGCSPGAWSQVVMEKIGDTGYLIGIDLLPTAPIHGATFLDFCDFTHEDTKSRLRSLLAERQKTLPLPQTPIPNTNVNDSRLIDLVLSDMAPNLSGVSSLDQSRATILAESVINFATTDARPSSSILMKVFGNPGPLRDKLSQFYKSTKIIKPKSSRTESSEVYIAGLGLMK